MLSPRVTANADKTPRSGYRGSDFVPWLAQVRKPKGRKRPVQRMLRACRRAILHSGRAPARQAGPQV